MVTNELARIAVFIGNPICGVAEGELLLFPLLDCKNITNRATATTTASMIKNMLGVNLFKKLLLVASVLVVAPVAGSV